MLKFTKKGFGTGTSPYYSAGGAVTYQPTAVAFTGTQYLTSTQTPMTGSADGTKGTVSFWFKMEGTDGTFQILAEHTSGKGLQIDRTNVNRWDALLSTAAFATVVDQSSNSTFVASGATWHHFLASWDSSVSPMGYLYIDDVADRFGFTQGGGTINYSSVSAFTVGARGAGSLPVNADIADFYFDQTAAYDLSNATNRRKFITAGLRPEDLGANGETPSGTTPILFMSANNKYGGATVANWGVNKGSGGTFTLTGSLSAASSNP